MRYLQRSIKYMFALSLSYVALVYLMSMLGLILISPEQMIITTLSSDRGVMMVVAIIALSATYPYFGFTRRKTEGNIERHREQIEDAFTACNFIMSSEKGGKLTFVGNSITKRIAMMFEDHVTVTQLNEQTIEIVGNRKAVAYILFRMEIAIERANERATTSI